jgi:hypothetical protein
MDAYLHYIRQQNHTKNNNIHIHPTFMLFHLYQHGWRTGRLAEIALQLAEQDEQRHIMSTRFMSIIVVNLYNEHWYVLLIYPSEQQIDILNSLATSQATVQLICRLMHAYLNAHAMVDVDFSFTASDWKITVINRTRLCLQTNGFDCGPITLKTIEYLVAGSPITFTQQSMRSFRFKLLLALRLKDIPWLRSPGQTLDTEQAISDMLKHDAHKRLRYADGVAVVEMKEEADSKDEKGAGEGQGEDEGEGEWEGEGEGEGEEGWENYEDFFKDDNQEQEKLKKKESDLIEEIETDDAIY